MRIRGRIKSLKVNYGFIEGIDSTDYFFHWSFLNHSSKTFKKLEEGDTVEFIPKIEDDKPKAMDIVSVD
jgi:cold shock CspA family protein